MHVLTGHPSCGLPTLQCQLLTLICAARPGATKSSFIECLCAEEAVASRILRLFVCRSL